MYINGLEALTVTVESDLRGWFAEFELVEDGQLVHGQDAVLSDSYGNRLVGHVVRYDVETCRGLIRCGPASLYESVDAKFIQETLSVNAFAQLGVSALVSEPGIEKLHVFCPAGTRLDHVRALCDCAYSYWRIGLDGLVHVGAPVPDLIAPDLTYDFDPVCGRVKIRGFACMPFELSTVNGMTPIAARWELDTDTTYVDFDLLSDPIGQLNALEARTHSRTELRSCTVVSQSDDQCKILLDNVECQEIPIVWGVPGVRASIVPGASAEVLLLNGRPQVIGFTASSITALTVEGGTDRLALSDNLESWMAGITGALKQLINDYNLHTNGGQALAVQTKASAPEVPEIRSIVRSI